MSLLKSRLWLTLFLLLSVFRAQAQDSELYPIVKVLDVGVVNVRKSVESTSAVVGKVRSGDTFAVIESEDNKYLILDGPNANGYISSQFVQMTGEKYPLVKSMAKGILIRAYPGKNGRIVASVNKNAYFAAVQKGEWYEIKDGPFRGRFINFGFARSIEETNSAPTAAAPMVVTPPPPPSQQVAEPEPEPEPPAPKPPPPQVEAKIEPPPPLPAPVPVPAPTPEPTPTPETPPAPEVTAPVVNASAQVASPNVRMRKFPSTNGKIAGVLKGDEKFEVEKKGDWYEIKSGPHKGNFIRGDFLKVTEAPAVKSEAASAELIAQQPPPPPPEPPPEPPPAPAPEPVAAPSTPPVTPAIAKVTGTNIRMRKFPSTNGKIAGMLKGDEQFEVEKQGDWYKITSGPYQGNFIKGDFVKVTQASATVAPEPAPAKAEAPGATVTTAKTTKPIRVRKAPGTNSEIAGALKADEQFEVEKQGDWYKITSGQYKGGFIRAALVKTETKPAPNTAATDKPEVKPPEPPKPPVTASPPAPNAPKWDAAQEKRFNEQVEKAFKKKNNSQESNQVFMPVYYEKSKSATGSVNTRVVGSNELEIDAPELMRILRKHIVEDWFEKPLIKKLPLEWVTVSAFKESGVQVIYDNLKLEILLLVPPDLRLTESLSLGENSVFGDEKVERQSMFSSFLNINATETIDSRRSSTGDIRMPVQAQLESGTNIANFVIEAYGNYTEDQGDNLANGKSPFVRQDVRMTRDFQKAAIRSSIGDVVYPVQGFQIYRQMQGVAFYRQYSISNSKVTYPTGNYEVFLKNKSKVSIWVNDQLQKVVELPAGRHNLKDFQYTSGMNNVRFEITDEFGNTEVQDHSYSASSDLLKPGLHQFSYAAGNPATGDSVSGERVYQSNSTFSGFHRYGFSNFFTGGVNAQIDSHQSIFGTEGGFSLKKGYLKADVLYGNTASVGSAYAAGMNYIYMDYKGPEKTQRSFTLGMIHRSPKFVEFGTTTAPDVSRPLNFSFGHSRGISKSMSANFGINYQLNKPLVASSTVGNSFGLRLGVSKRWANGLSANVTGNHTKNTAGKDEIGIMGFLIWSFPKEKQTVSAYGNSSDSSARIGWNYNPDSGADAATYQANYRETKLEKGYSATGTLNGNRARAALSHEVVQTKRDEPTTEDNEADHAENVTTMQLGAGLVFAGGHFAIGRPVTDSFAIVAPIKSLKGRELRVNPDQDDNYTAKSSWLGPAVVPELSSYNATSLVVGAKNLPLGVSIPQDHFNLYPRFKSGYSFPLGTDPSIYLQIILHNQAGQPVAMVAGLASNLSDASSPSIPLFTSRKGVLQSEGFKAGSKYRIEIGDKYQPVEIEVPKDAKEEYNLGTVKLKEK